jgi:hypothetical protein
MKHIYQKFIPLWLKNKIQRFRIKIWRFRIKIQRSKIFTFRCTESELKRLEIIRYFEKRIKTIKDKEELAIAIFFLDNDFSVFPYNFTKNYNADGIIVFIDDECKMKYILHENKRMYFPEGWEANTISNYYNGLLIEQDPKSPHRYETNDFHVKEGDIIADIGSAEGMWALSNVENSKKIYLFECEKEWIKPLRKTFEPWKEKVHVINKYVSNINDEKNITLDKFFKGKEINFIKADIEGAELSLLEGAMAITMRNELKIILCTYHRQNDANDLQNILNERKFITEYSKGYMIFIHDENLSPPYLRRGVIRAKKTVQ